MTPKDIFIATIVPLIVGIYAILRARSLSRLRAQTASWIQSKGFIREAKIVGWGRGRVAAIVYEYYTPDKRFGSRICPVGCEMSDPRIYLRRYPPGQEVDVFFDPQSHHLSFLELPSGQIIKAWQTMAGIGFTFPIFYLIWLLFLAHSTIL